MRYTTPVILLLCALVAALASLLGDDAFAELDGLQKSLEHQKRANTKLTTEVSTLKRTVRGLQSDPRAIERAARQELGMVRENEVMVVFKDEKPKKK